MKKTWTLSNGWKRMNSEGQLILCEICPRDFDEDSERHEQNAAQGYHTASYERVGSYYVFWRKRDWLAAIDTLSTKGYFA